MNLASLQKKCDLQCLFELYSLLLIQLFPQLTKITYHEF